MLEGNNPADGNRDDQSVDEKVLAASDNESGTINEIRILCEKTFAEYSEQKFSKTLTTDDEWVERFLKANHSVKKAVSAIEGCLEWRREEKVDTYRDWKVKPEWKEVGMYLINGVFQGLDNMGRPLLIINVAEDLQKVVRTCGGKSNFLEAMKLLQIQLQEYIADHLIPQLREKGSTKSYDCTAILDLSNFGYRHVGSITYAYLSLVSSIQDNYYPLCIKKSYVIKAPRIFGMAWKVLKKILPQNITNSIHFCEKNFLPELLEVIPQETIPQSLGGKSNYEIGNHPIQLEFENLGQKIEDEHKVEITRVE